MDALKTLKNSGRMGSVTYKQDNVKDLVLVGSLSKMCVWMCVLVWDSAS